MFARTSPRQPVAAETSDTQEPHANAGAAIDQEFGDALRDVVDPEIGVNIVDLGLLYRAKWTVDGIGVLMTMTSPSCPVAEVLVDEVRGALRRSFPDAAAISIELVWDPPWSPARISDEGRRQLGWPTKTGAATKPASAWPAAFFRSHRRH